MADRIHFGSREPYGEFGGINSYIRLLAAGQRAIGFTPVVAHNIDARGSFKLASPDETPSGEQDLETVPTSFANIPTSGKSDRSARYHFHMAHGAWPVLQRFARSGERLPKSACVYHFHGPWFLESRVAGDGLASTTAKWFYESATYRRFDRFIVASGAFADILRRRFPVGTRPVHVVHPGVDTGRFVPGSMDVARNKLGLNDTGTLYVCVRRLEARMGIEHAILAMKRLPGATLAIVGGGSMEGRLRALVEQEELSGRVRFLGRVPQEALPLVYQAADAAVVPTAKLEGFGLVVLEAFATGCPVVSTRVGGLVEAMGPFAHDCTAPPGDPIALASALADIVRRGPGAHELRSYAETRDLSAMARRVEDALASGVVAGRARPKSLP